MELSQDFLSGLPAFILLCLAVEITPGPNMAYLAVTSIDRGRQAGLVVVAGVAVGLALVGLASALGLGALISGSDLLYEGLRWAGFVFMLWLAYEAWTKASESSRDWSDPATNWSAYFRRGVLVNLFNPKAALFFIAIFPTFIADAGSPTLQAVILMALYLSLATAIHLAIVMGASSVRSVLENQGLNRGIRRMLSLLLVLVAFWIAYSAAR